MSESENRFFQRLDVENEQRLKRDGTSEPVSLDQNLRLLLEQGHRKIFFHAQPTTSEQDWQPYRFIQVEARSAFILCVIILDKYNIILFVHTQPPWYLYYLPVNRACLHSGLMAA